MKRVVLENGQWAELRERITHGEDKILKRTYLRGRESIDARGEWDTMAVRIFVRAWSLVDPDTNDPIPLDIGPDPETGVVMVSAAAVNRADGASVEKLAIEAAHLYNPAAVPNPPTPPSSDASPSAG